MSSPARGTIGLEIVETLPDVRTIVVPVSGGGLAAGIALSAKAARPDLRIIGVSSERCPAMKRSVEAGRPMIVPERENPPGAPGGGGGPGKRLAVRGGR